MESLVFLTHPSAEFSNLLNVGWLLIFYHSFYLLHAHPLRCVRKDFTGALRKQHLLRVLIIYTTKQSVPLNKQLIIHDARKINKEWLCQYRDTVRE